MFLFIMILNVLDSFIDNLTVIEHQGPSQEWKDIIRFHFVLNF